MTTKSTINFRNLAQAALFRSEILGQLSDGMWENASPYRHWYAWSNAKVAVNPKNVGCNFYAQKRNYNLTALIAHISERMSLYMAMAITYPEAVAKLIESGTRLPYGSAWWEYAEKSGDKFSSELLEKWQLAGLTKVMVQYVENNVSTIVTDKMLRNELADMKRIMKTDAIAEIAEFETKTEEPTTAELMARFAGIED